MYRYHLAALLLGTILDMIIGDPYGIWHPIVVIGGYIDMLDGKLLKDGGQGQEKERRLGLALVVLVLVPVICIMAFIMYIAYRASLIGGLVIEAIFSCYCLAGHSLIKESGAVVRAYRDKGIVAARQALSMIVGRDTAHLDEPAILRATVETVAENASDGVVAPFLYLLLGGPVLGMLYKAINTMDSMVGYHNDRYENFGRAAARLDDVANYIPSRLTALLTVLAAFCLGPRYSGMDAWRIFKRDRYNHKSPNSAQSESAYAGALGLQLGGPAYYFGKLVDKPTIGDATKSIEISDVARAHRLLMVTMVFGVILCIILMAASLMACK